MGSAPYPCICFTCPRPTCEEQGSRNKPCPTHPKPAADPTEGSRLVCSGCWVWGCWVLHGHGGLAMSSSNCIPGRCLQVRCAFMVCCCSFFFFIYTFALSDFYNISLVPSLNFSILSHESLLSDFFFSAQCQPFFLIFLLAVPSPASQPAALFHQTITIPNLSCWPPSHVEACIFSGWRLMSVGYGTCLAKPQLQLRKQRVPFVHRCGSAPAGSSFSMQQALDDEGRPTIPHCVHAPEVAWGEPGPHPGEQKQYTGWF